MNTLEDKIYGCLLGGLIGDAMGAPGEGKTYTQIAERFGPTASSTSRARAPTIRRSTSS